MAFESTNSSHWLGIIGECFNLLGALILALDVFLRNHERRLESNLAGIGDFARKNNLNNTIYKGSLLTDSAFPWNVLDRKATFIAYLGSACLTVGFSLLIAHHSLELLHSGHERSHLSGDLGPTKFRESETK